jgi:hypothetical protein
MYPAKAKFLWTVELHGFIVAGKNWRARHLLSVTVSKTDGKT